MIFTIFIFLVITFSEIFYFIKEQKQLKDAILINFYELIEKIQENNIEKIHYIYKNNNNYLFKEYYLIQAQDYSKQKYYCYIPVSFYNFLLYYINYYKSFLKNVTTTTKTNYLELYISFILFLSSFIFMFYIVIQLKKQFFYPKRNFSQKNYQNKSKINFENIAGLKKEKEEIYELVDFLKNPQKYTNLGISIPKGVLLEGPPGTGKTLLAKALAGESGFPFYATSGSEFVEMYVGVGAARIRNLFQEIKQNTPCVLFVDEIDALGIKRGSNLHNSEKDQTLNQLLIEMDGFEPLHQIIVIAATNRVDILDPALLRPGRFDRIIKINLPDLKARKAILEVHARNKKINNYIDFEQLAKQTEGANGAQLAAILNEALILAIREQKEFIDLIILEKALDRVLLGVA
ncbi:ATP-binding protein [Candidatus Phytoplasma solani]|uniref:AAA family ATPase n=1 Tax=Candidatus Phytoplasma solani TaxID=69896 RepID=UPI0032DB9944